MQGSGSGQDLYEILGVSKDASSIEIKKAYRKLALQHHPDKVVEELREDSEIRFKEISHAYEVLSDEDKRANYDEYGVDDGSVPFGNGNGDEYGFGFAGADGGADFGPEDFFRFFGGGGGAPNGGGGARQPPRKSKTEDARISVDITLEDLFKGKVIKTTSSRNIICKHCKGSGLKQSAKLDTCSICQGKGSTEKLRRMGPGLVTRHHVTCNNCEGLGKIARKKDRCKKCDGKKTTEETKILEFNIEKGSPNKGEVILKEESDQEPGKITGDVILTYTAKTHDKFERKGDDLFFKLNIKLFEALCGFKKPNLIKTLDNRLLTLSVPQGKVLKPGDFIKVANEGMPKLGGQKSWFGSTEAKGDLYIELEIEFPQDNWFLEKNELTTVRSILSNVKYPTKLQKPNDQATEEAAALLDDDVDSFTIEKFTIARAEALPDYKDDDFNENNNNAYNDADYEYGYESRNGAYGNGYGDANGYETECQQQ